LNDQPLIFLADESCDFAFVRVLRQVGYDVTAIAEFMPGASDLKVLESAFEERRILITEDKDFGEWVFGHKRATVGILLVRYPANMRSKMTQAMVELVSEHGRELRNRYAILEPGRVRIRTIK
jgi:predicted nuclease of predicted toxin-antitoxin system